MVALPWTTIGIGIALLVFAVVAYRFMKPRRREGFQQVAAGATPAELIGNAEACKMMKNVLGTVEKQIAEADAINNPAQLELLKTTKTSLEQQIAALACA